MEKFLRGVHNKGGLFRPQEAPVKKRTMTISKPRAIREPVASARVVRVSEETWTAKIVEASQRGKPMEVAAYFDRALRLYTKAS